MTFKGLHILLKGFWLISPELARRRSEERDVAWVNRSTVGLRKLASAAGGAKAKLYVRVRALLPRCDSG